MNMEKREIKIINKREGRKVSKAGKGFGGEGIC